MSYAREDSDFALELGKDLRSAGAIIWMDQLDIPAGERWDLAVQRALEKSRRMLVILSPASVSSNNVLDEVRYAIDEGKIVIPVLFRDCQVPFWLRRLQRVDVRSGLAELLQVLGGQDNTGALKISPGRPSHEVNVKPAPTHLKPVKNAIRETVKNAIRLIDCQVRTPIGAPGDQIEIDYILDNSSAFSITVWLGASLVKDGKEFYNTEQDELLQIEPGRHTATRSLIIGNIPIPNRADDVAQLIAAVWYGPKSDPDQSLQLATSSKIPIIILPA